MFIKKFIKKQLALVLLTFTLLAVGLGGTTYALFQKTFTDNKTQSISVGDMNIVFSNGTMQGGEYVELSDSNEVTINGSGTGIMPMSDTDALASNDNIYTFVIYNSGTIAYNYTVKLEDNENYTTNLLSHSYIRYKLTGDMKESINSATTSSIVDSTPDLLSNATNGIIYNYIINPGEVHEFTLRVWVAEAEEYELPNEALGQEAHLNINIEGEASKNRPAPAPTGWYDAPNTILLGAIKENYPDGPSIWTIPGQQTNYMGSLTAFDVNTTYDKYYWTYGTGYEIVDGNFNLTGASTLKYDTNYKDLVGKYLVSNTAANSSNETDAAKTTTNLSNIYYVHHVTENKVYYETYYIMPISASQANQEWTYAEDVEQVGTYSDTKGKFNLINTTKVNYQNNKADFVGKLLPGNTASDNYAASPSLTNKTTLYEVIEAEDTYIVYHNPIESEIGATKDDYGMSYYFRGDVENNYVIFANMCWRIVRIDGAGNVKLALYNYNPNSLSNPCTEGNSSGAFARYAASGNGANGYSEFNSTSVRDTANGTNRTAYNYNAGIGYMFGTPNSNGFEAEHASDNKSTILINLMTWYDNNIRTGGYDEKLADVIWCNDKRLPESSTFNPSNYTNTNLNVGYGDAQGFYRTSERLASSTSWSVSSTTAPSLKCGDSKEDNKISKYTASDTEYGNGMLKVQDGTDEITGEAIYKYYKIGLLTADEVAFAGARNNSTNYGYYLTNNTNKQYYWTSSPSNFSGSGAFVWYVGSNGNLDCGFYVNYAYGLRPAVSLKSDVTVTGSGTRTNPFVVQ